MIAELSPAKEETEEHSSSTKRKLHHLNLKTIFRSDLLLEEEEYDDESAAAADLNLFLEENSDIVRGICDLIEDEDSMN